MADYENRLRRLEELAADTSADDRNKEFGELIRKRTAAFLNSKEMLAYTGPEVSEDEWVAEWDVLQAAVKAAQSKR